MRCGIGDYTMRLGESLASRANVEVAILTSTAAATGRPVPGVELFPLMERWTLAERGKVRRLIRSWRPQIVHVQFPTQGYGPGDLPHLIPLIAHRLDARVVRTLHEVATWDRLTSRRQLLGFLLQLLAPGPFVTVRPNYRQLLHPLLARLSRKHRWIFIPSASTIPPAALSPRERRDLRATYLQGRERLVTYFGFLNASKGAELLFDIADPKRDQVVFAGAFGPDEDYRRQIEQRAAAQDWAGKVTFPGFIGEREAAGLLAVSDAVVLPFREGGGSWNTSILAALAQGTPVVTTSGSAGDEHLDGPIFFAPPGDLHALRQGLDRVACPPDRRPPGAASWGWTQVADRHHQLYEEMGAAR